MFERLPFQIIHLNPLIHIEPTPPVYSLLKVGFALVPE